MANNPQTPSRLAECSTRLRGDRRRGERLLLAASAGSPSGAVRSADLLGVFGLQVIGSGLAPQRALRAPSRHGPYSGNCRKVPRPPVPGSERAEWGGVGRTGRPACSALDPSASRLPPAHIPTGHASPRPTAETRRGLFRTPKGTSFSVRFPQPDDFCSGLAVKNLRPRPPLRPLRPPAARHRGLRCRE